MMRKLFLESTAIPNCVRALMVETDADTHLFASAQWKSIEQNNES